MFIFLEKNGLWVATTFSPQDISPDMIEVLQEHADGQRTRLFRKPW